jgi:phosphoglycolate phosphatase
MALVTNNTDANTSLLLDRFGLRFDVVLTRDSGLWKPSGAPLAAAMGELGVSPERCLAVGDSMYDVLAAREAGCKVVCLLHDEDGKHRDRADLAFDDLAALKRYLEVVL